MSEPGWEKPALLKTVDVLLEKTCLSKQLSKENDEYKGICPFCGQDGFTFHVLLETYRCQACGNKGNLLRFVIQYTPIGVKNKVDAWNWLAEMMFEEREKGRYVDMAGWVLED
jgi:hypothetical protein